MIDERFKVGSKYKVKGSSEPLIYIYSKDEKTGVFFSNNFGKNFDVDTNAMAMVKERERERALHAFVIDEMKQTGLLKCQFAKEIGVSGQTFCRFLRRKSKPGERLKLALANYWNVPPKTIEDYYNEWIN